MQEELQATATILALVNPAMCASIFLRAESTRTPRERTGDAVRGVLSITAILVVAALAGTGILEVFGVSLSAFACAGGGILIWIGVGMLRAAADGVDDAGGRGGSSLAPLILFGASPGTITGVITVAAAHSERSLPMTALVAIGVTASVLLTVLVLAARFGGGGHQGGLARQIVTSYMGLIVIAMGIQFALTGFKEFMVG